MSCQWGSLPVAKRSVDRSVSSCSDSVLRISSPLLSIIECKCNTYQTKRRVETGSHMPVHRRWLEFGLGVWNFPSNGSKLYEINDYDTAVRPKVNLGQTEVSHSAVDPWPIARSWHGRLGIQPRVQAFRLDPNSSPAGGVTLDHTALAAARYYNQESVVRLLIATFVLDSNLPFYILVLDTWKLHCYTPCMEQNPRRWSRYLAWR